MMFHLSLSFWKIGTKIHLMTWLTCLTRDHWSGVQFTGMDWQCCFLKDTPSLPRSKIRGTSMERFLAQNSQRSVTMFCLLDWGCCWRVLPSGFPFLFVCAVRFLQHRIRRTCLNSVASTLINRTTGFLYLLQLTIICGLQWPRHFDFYWSSRWFWYDWDSNDYDIFLVALCWLSSRSDFHIQGFSHTDVVLCKRLRNNKKSDEDCREWNWWLVEEGSEEDGYDIFNVRREEAIPFLPFWVGIINGKFVDDVGWQEVWEFLNWEKDLSLVCSLVMEVEREERLSLTAKTREEKNSVANVGEPTSWLRRRKPVMAVGSTLGLSCW